MKKILMLATALLAAQVANAASCNRDCLRNTITQYLGAMLGARSGQIAAGSARCVSPRTRRS